MTLDKIMYSTEMHVTGGRDGNASSADGKFNLKLSTPKEMGGAGGDGTNPEQLFAAGYAACFLGAMGLVAGKRKVALPKDTAINSVISLGQSAGKLGIAAVLNVSLPGMDKAAAEALVQEAHQVCPYSNATRNNIDVTLNVSV